MEEMSMVEEEVVTIHIATTTTRMVLESEIFLVILAVPIGMPFRGAVEYMLAVNADAEKLVAESVATAHEGDVDMEEDDIFQKLILIGMTLSVEDVVAEDAMKGMALDLKKECIDSYVFFHWKYVVYLNYDPNTTSQ